MSESQQGPEIFDVISRKRYLRETLSFERQGSASVQTLSNNPHSSTKHSLKNNPTSMEFNQATPKCIPDDSPVSVQQHDT